MLPENYKIKIEKNLKKLWDVWCSLGIYSAGPAVPMPPEEAIIGLCILGRYDQRLFDEAISFIILHSRLISKNRILSNIRKIDNDSQKVFKIIGAILVERGVDGRFVSIIQDEIKTDYQEFFISLNKRTAFSGKNEDDVFRQFGFKRNNLVVSDKIRNLDLIAQTNPWINAKLLFGNTVRADTILEIINNEKCTAPEIASKTGYTQKSIWNVLKDLEVVGLVYGKKTSNRIDYRVSDSGKKMFSQFNIRKTTPEVTEWIKLGHIISAFKKLPENASELLIRSEEKRVERIINGLKI